MAYPSDLPTVTVRHRIVGTDGTPARGGGRVTAVLTGRLWTGQGSVVPTQYTATVQEDGTYELVLPPVDHPDIVAGRGEAYLVTEPAATIDTRRPGRVATEQFHVAPTTDMVGQTVDVSDVLVNKPKPGGGVERVTITGPATDESLAGIIADPSSQTAVTLKDTIAAEADAPARAAAVDELSRVPEVADAAATRAVTVAADPAIAGTLDTPDSLTRQRLDNPTTGYARTAHRPVNVRDLNADTTGQADVAPLVSGVQGREVYFPPGTYRLDTPVILGAGTRWRGESGATELRAGASTGTEGLITANADSGVTGLAIDGNELARFAIVVQGAGQTVRDVTAHDTLHAGYYLKAAAGASFSNVRAIDCGRPANPTAAGFFVQDCDSPRFVACVAEGSQEHGWYVLGGNAAGAQLIAPVARGNGGCGISLREQGSSILGGLVTGNGRSGLETGYRIQTPTPVDTAETTITGTVFRDNTGDREVLLSAAQRVTVTGIVVDTNRSHGFRADTVQSLTINGGVFRLREAVGANSVMRFANCTDVTLTGAHITGPATPAGSGVYFDSSSGFTAVGNHLANLVHGFRYMNAVSDTFAVANRFKNVTTRYNENAVSSGTNRFPVPGPASATGADAATINAIRDALVTAGILR